MTYVQARRHEADPVSGTSSRPKVSNDVKDMPEVNVMPLVGAVLFVVVTGLGMCAAAAQEHTDFSGRWLLETPAVPAADVPRALSVRQSVVRMNFRGEPMKPFFKDIAIEKTFETTTRTETHQIGVIGGLVGGTAGRPAEPSAHFAVTWDGDALVFEHRFGNGSDPPALTWTERREVWSLDTTGKLRVVVTTHDPVSGRRNSALVYRREAP